MVFVACALAIVACPLVYVVETTTVTGMSAASLAAEQKGLSLAVSPATEFFPQPTASEKKILANFVAWGRRVNAYGEPTNPVVLLTSHELTMDHHLTSTWKALGGEHGKFATFEHTRSLSNLADATQQIYLGMPSFHQVRDEYWTRRHAQRKGKQKGA